MTTSRLKWDDGAEEVSDHGHGNDGVIEEAAKSPEVNGPAGGDSENIRLGEARRPRTDTRDLPGGRAEWAETGDDDSVRGLKLEEGRAR